MIDPRTDINIPAAVEEVRAVFERYEDAGQMEAEGIVRDLQTVIDLFWDSEHTIRYGTGENHYSFADIEHFRRTYRPPFSQRRVLRCVITTYGRDFATTNLEYERGTLHGRQSQTWARLPEGWRIVAAHVSYLRTA